MEKFIGQDIADVNMRKIFLTDNADAAALFEEIKETEIDKQLASIREIAPDIAIIEV